MREVRVIFAGIDWAEAHHDVCVMAEDGRVLEQRRVGHSVAGIGELHALVGAHAADGEPVAAGIEVDRGLVVTALLAAGYQVFAVNPLAAARYRDRHGTSGAKSDRGDAKVLADLVRTDRHNHRQVAGDSDLADAVRVLARAHQSAIWARQRQVNALRSALREYYPAALAAFGTDLAAGDAAAVLAIAPGPEAGRALSRAKIAAALRRAGRQRRIGQRAGEIQAVLRADHLQAPPAATAAYAVAARSAIRLISAYTAEIAELEQALTGHFDQHPDAAIVRSLPGLGTVLGARVLGESGDDRTRFTSPQSRKNYAGTSPVTRASGRSRTVLARHARNRRLAGALDQWAFCSLTQSPGARAYYHQLRGRGKTHHQALRQLANRWTGILHTCLQQGHPYNEHTAWAHLQAAAA
jgi:transposase/transposase IS116/IS110/IS902 family protein